MDNTLYVKYDDVLIKRGFKLNHAKPGDVGFDMMVVMDERLKVQPHTDYYINWKERWFDIPPHGSAEIPCGMAVKIPENAWGNIKGRSSTAWKRKLVVIEGVIDSQYVGALYILVNNPNSVPVRISEFDRLAQLIIVPKYYTDSHDVKPVQELPKTIRMDTGFGSTNF